VLSTALLVRGVPWLPVSEPEVFRLPLLRGQLREESQFSGR
jgi:hypothetical protein